MLAVTDIQKLSYVGLFAWVVWFIWHIHTGRFIPRPFRYLRGVFARNLPVVRRWLSDRSEPILILAALAMAMLHSWIALGWMLLGTAIWIRVRKHLDRPAGRHS